jgi:hypothetical protein
MVGWLTALLFTLIAIATIKVREGADDTLTANPVAMEATSNAISRDYQQLLDAYSSAFIASKTSKDERPVTLARAAISDYQSQMQQQVSTHQFHIQTFLDNYKGMNPDLDSLHSQSQLLHTQGPLLADELAASTTATPPQIDYGGMITRVVVLMLIVLAASALSAS